MRKSCRADAFSLSLSCAHTWPLHTPTEPRYKLPQQEKQLLASVAPWRALVAEPRAVSGEQGLQQVSAIASVSERTKQIKFISEKVTRAKHMHHSMKVELQDVEPRDQKKYEKKVNDFHRRLGKAQTELKAAKNSTVSLMGLIAVGCHCRPTCTPYSG